MKSKVLYKQSSTGKIVTWFYSVKENVITFSHGQLDGKLIVEDYVLDEGKNIGKKTETTPAQQALIKARQKFEKKLKSGYTPDLELAKSTKDILDGVKPMLAEKIEDFPKKVVYPGIAQPKLDGFRCTATLKNGVCTLHSKTQRKLETMGHIAREIEKMYGDKDIELDGELYLHEFCGDFAYLSHLIKSDDPSVEYHLYDCVTEGGYLTRIKDIFIPPKGKTITAVTSSHASGVALHSGSYSLLPPQTPTKLFMTASVRVSSKEELDKAYNMFMDLGYEGAMFRNMDAEYVHKRTPNLLKVKEFEDAEFTIIGVNEGAGKLRGSAGSFTMDNKDGQTFGAKLKGSFGNLKRPFTHPEEFIGKQLTVRFQGRYKSNKPRFPVGKAIREE